MKIKAFLFATLLLAGASAFAQEATETKSDKGPTDSFISHSFKENWFIGVGGGLNFVVDLPAPIFQGIGGAADINFGKWLDPMWGIRAGFNGVAVRDRAYADANGDPQKYYFVMAHGDVMWNITNQFWGYKKDRVWQVIPYLSAGFFKPFNAGAAEFMIGPGLLNKIRLTEKLDLDIDPNFYLVRQHAFNSATAGGKTVFASVLVGVSYKLGKNPGWETKADALLPATVAAAEAAAALAAAQADNEELAEKAAKAEEAQAEAAKENEGLKEELATSAAQNDSIVKNLMNTPAVVYFEIGQATLSVKELAHFDRIVKTMLEPGSKSQKINFTLTGITDHNTGSVKRNKQLQKQRSNYIQKLLTDKYGLDKDQFEIVIDESARNKYTTIELNRAVIIESAKEEAAE